MVALAIFAALALAVLFEAAFRYDKQRREYLAQFKTKRNRWAEFRAWCKYTGVSP